MHLMIWDTEMDMYRGITFFEPDIPKYKTVKECQQKGMEIIGKSIIQLNRNQIKTGQWEVNCLEVKGEKA